MNRSTATIGHPGPAAVPGVWVRRYGEIDLLLFDDPNFLVVGEEEP